MNRALTQIVDVDISILNNLSDLDLIQACRVNKYTYRICQLDELWRDRINRYLDPKYLQSKLDSMSWKEWYFLWSRHQPDLIGDQLGLNILDAGRRLLTQDGYLVPESIVYQGIGQNLIQALQDDRDDLVPFLLHRYRILKELRSVREIPNLILDYGRVIKVGCRHHRYEYITEIIQDLHDLHRDGTVDEIIRLYTLPEMDQDVAIGLGYLNRLAEYQSLVEVITELDLSGLDDLEGFFILGLIQGRNRPQAMARFRHIYGLPNVHLSIRLFTKLVKTCLQQEEDWTDFLRLLQNYIVDNPTRSEIEKIYYFKALAKGALQAGRIDLAFVYQAYLDPHDVIIALGKDFPEQALAYLQTQPIIRVIDSTSLVRTSNLDLAIYCLNHEIPFSVDVKAVTVLDLLQIIRSLRHKDPNGVQLDSISILSDAISMGRYDVVERIDILTQDSTFKTELIDSLDDILDDLATRPYKDIFIYLIQRYHPNVDTLLENLNQNQEMLIEIKLIVDSLIDETNT